MIFIIIRFFIQNLFNTSDKSKPINGKNEDPVPVFNGKHKWKDSIDSRFDKLVALVEHQIEHSSWPRGGGVAVQQKF